jgi:hypothetical protein
MPATMTAAARIFRTGPRAEPRMAAPSAEDHPKAPRSSGYRVAARDLHSSLQLFVDAVVIVLLSIVTGVAYHRGFLNETGPVRDFAYTGVVIAVLFAGIGRLVAGHHAATLTSGFERFREAALVWNLAFGALVLILFSLKAGEQLSRGAVFFFYLVGLPAIGIWTSRRTGILCGVGRECSPDW